MQNYGQKDREEERKKLNSALDPEQGWTETDPEIVKKFMVSEPYTKADINKCMKEILYKNRINWDFLIIDHTQTFNIGIFDINDDYDPYSILYEERINNWVLIILFRHKHDLFVFHKSSTGSDIDPGVKRILNDKLNNPNIIVNKSNDQEGLFPNAPLCLRNVNLMMKNIKKIGPEKYITGFKQFQFATQANMRDAKLEDLLVNTIELSKNKEFKKQLKDFVDSIPLSAAEQIKSYQKILGEEVTKEDETKIDVERIKKARESLINSKELNEFKKKVNIKEETLNIESELEKKFPDEIQKLQKIFRLLSKVKVNEDLNATLKSIAKILDLDYKKLKIFYQDTKVDKDDDICNDLECVDINKIKIPEQEKVKSEQGIASLEELLAKLILGPDPEHIKDIPSNLTKEEYKGIYGEDQNKLELEELFHKVQHYYESWGQADTKMINAWAKGKRGTLGHSSEEICEAIAVMDRAFNLLTGKFRLRYAQILGALTFLIKSSYEGRLSQIETGEGKTSIVSLLATIKVLQGSTVDVITSNAVLAQEGVKETKDFYGIFGITVASNTKKVNTETDRKVAGLEPDNDDDSDNKVIMSYKADVLYGTISAFQFDYLKDTVEGWNTRQKRKFDVVILDEVDSMLIDNGSHIAKLTTPFPGMESLRYIYIKIWQELLKSEEKFFAEAQKKVSKKLESIKKDVAEQKASKQICQEEYDDYVQILMESQMDELKATIKKAFKQIQVDLIPPHLNEFADSKIDIWINNAIFARYQCNEFEQYRLLKDEETKEYRIMPVDYLNTGITMKNTIWSNGLHQFIQLKHNLFLTYESLTSSFISNIGYIKNYPARNIFGMTGTLGSTAEQNLLASIYNVNFAKVPPYKAKSFKEVVNHVSEDDDWSATVCAEMLGQIDKGRSVLLISETENDLKLIKEDLDVAKKMGLEFNVRIYAHEEDIDATRQKVAPKEIILSTNLAGRGTDFKTTPELEQNGGLHVCVGFLPYNLRVEGQAYGRTARQGKTGTAQMVIRKSEALQIGLEEKELDNFKEVKFFRDQHEAKRLEEIRTITLSELNFKDELFGFFATLHRTLKTRARNRDKQIVLRDLKEYWAFWLDKKNYDHENIKNKTPQQEFEQFKKDASKLIEKDEVQHNPFHLISLGQYYAEDLNDLDKGKTYLEKAINFHKGNYALMYGAHLKLFHIAIESGRQMQNRIYKALAKIVFVDLKVDDSYKTNAVKALKDALVGINKELQFIKAHFGIRAEDDTEPETDFQGIIEETKEGEENYLVKHITSRFACLSAYKNNLDDIVKKIEETNGGIIISDKSDDYLSKLDKESKTDVIGEVEIMELAALGMDAVYSIRPVYDASSVVIHGAQVQFGIGIAALVAGLIFPPIFPTMQSIATTCICEAVIDIVVELISGGKSEFNLKDYIKGKFISYAISLITLGVTAILQCIKVVSKALEYCRKFATLLRNSKYLKPLCERLAKIVDKFAKVLENTLTKLKFNQLSKLDQLNELKNLQKTNLDKFKLLGGDKQITVLNKLTNNGLLRDPTRNMLFINTATAIGKKVGKKILKKLFKKFVLKPVMDYFFKDVMKEVRKNVKKYVLEELKPTEELKKKLRTNKKDVIDGVIKKFVGTDPIVKMVHEIASGVLGNMDNLTIDLITLSVETIVSGVKLAKYLRETGKFLEDNLPSDGTENNDVDKMLDDVAGTMADKVLDLIQDILDKTMSVTKKLLKMKYDKMKEKQKKKDDKNKLVVGEDGNDGNEGGDGGTDGNGGGSNNQINNDFLTVGVSRDASASEIDSAFRRMALRLHPDKNPGDPNATRTFQDLNGAYNRIKEHVRNRGN